MFCFFLLLPGSSLPSPNLKKKKMHGTPPLNFFLSFCSIFSRFLLLLFVVPHFKLMACYSLNKKKVCLHRRRFAAVVPFRKMTICQVNRQATFFKIVLFYMFTRLTWIHSSFMYCTLYTRIFEVTFDIFVLETYTAFLLI